MSWFNRLMPSRIRTEGKRRQSVPEGLWTKCPNCQSVLYKPELERLMQVCPKCDSHLTLGARARLQGFFDEDSTEELAAEVAPMDPLRFRDEKRYRDRLQKAQQETGEKDALVAMQGSLHGMPLVAAAFEFRFMGGSMGSVVGERFVRAVEHCLHQRLPFVCFVASGGARMQEGLFSLLQMSKTAGALARLAEKRLPYIVVLGHPTTGGVAASLAMLGDVIIAEPQSLIGFAGPRVIQQTVGQTLPAGFQRAEFLLEHGAIDMIVPRRELRERIHKLLVVLRDNRLPDNLPVCTGPLIQGNSAAP